MAIAVGAVAVCAAVAWADPTTPGGVIPPCPTYSLFGILCPGCGSSRMLYSLVHLDVPAALHYNALGLVALAVLTVSFGLWTWSRARGTPMPRWTRYRWPPHLVLILTAMWFVVRNIPVAPFTALRI
ncbi:DUF2752 domain-containing protein [Rhodococcus pyridinivorans]|nr:MULTISPECIES: DUF2752 domain-containing protein [Rhodococcus]EHK85476.1 hypothetical protein AK37_04058 [Rhodococcus pyridinivorans AK37]MBX4168753.1 DUF2752 domain-containing protein [Rhodococcus sp. DMU2021]MCD2119513.1 DUF2752 domain-containing protein [Rhodococcus pyridinivorans]MCD2140755.1 DUF2752 domain-containing protein [Rhodococcus pyridinivorans]MCD5419627.1 DUF2752 domain-containing protein [Rhodococcus pyridinivorans]